MGILESFFLSVIIYLAIGVILAKILYYLNSSPSYTDQDIMLSVFFWPILFVYLGFMIIGITIVKLVRATK
jgi:hypothetical protein